MVGADLALLVNEAALFAARREHARVAACDDFTDAIEKIILGAERRVVMTEADRERTAYHESGHALVGHAHAGRRPGPQGLDHPARPGARRHAVDAGGRPLRLRARGAARRIKVALGGRAAEQRRLRRDHDRRGVRPAAAHADRPRHGRPLGHERSGRAGDRRGLGRRGPLLPAPRRSPSARRRSSTRRSGGSSRRPRSRRSRCSSASATRLEALARALLERETLDQPEAYAIAGVEQPVAPAGDDRSGPGVVAAPPGPPAPTAPAAMLVAIDGPAGAGKSTVARAVADALGFTYLDSGAMYRAVALAGDRDPASLEIAFADGRVLLDGEDVTDAIRAPAVSRAASRRAAEPAVRAAMAERQRALLAAGDWVAEGRDIGTVIAPHAELKVWLDASPRSARAAASCRPRRSPSATDRDASREHSPMVAAPDAVQVDTTGLAIDEVVERIAKLARGGTPDDAAVAIVGYPNVGKSSLVNRLSGSRGGRRARALRDHPRPPRDPREWNGRRFMLVDTGGMDSSTPTRSPTRSATRRRPRWPTRRSRCSSSTRGRACGPATPSWRTSCAAAKLPVIVAANKVDVVADVPLAAEFHGLGLGDPHPV